MSKVCYGFAYLNPEKGFLINSIGSTEIEAGVNLSAIEIPDNVIKRLKCIPVKILYESEKETTHD